MADLGKNVQVVEIIMSARDVTVRFHENKVFNQKVFPVDTTIIFRDGALTADKDELPIEEAVA